MNKVICDVCGTDYPETASQCPICGTANAGGGQTSAGNTVQAEESTYSPTKGGHFSKSNVRKRMKSSANQQPELPISNRYDESDDDGFDEDELEGVSNKGLVVIVVLLLLAIIAVSSYIVITFFGDKDSKDPTPTTGTSQSPTDQATEPSGTDTTEPSATEPSESKPDVDRIPCTGLVVEEAELELVNQNPMQIKLMVQPANTTDPVSYASADKSIATVDASGRVKAVGNGKTTITITCGDQKTEIVVKCQLEEPTDPTSPTDPTDPGETTEPTAPSVTVELKLNRDDFTLSYFGESWMLYNGELDPADITWSSSNEAVATVENGKVVGVGHGSAKIFAEYGDQKVFCYVRCSFETPEPTDPSEDSTEPSEEVTEPSEEVTEPSEEVTEPSEEATEPSEEATEPSEEVTDPSGEPTAPSEEPTEPSEEVTDPSEEVTEPSEESTEPSEEVTEPSEEAVEHKLLINNWEPAYLFENKQNSADVMLYLGMGANISDCTISITNAENVQWHNNDEAVCSFDPATGKVTAVAVGRALLTATVDGVEYIVCIRVSNP